MTIEIGSALADRLAAAHRAERTRSRAARSRAGGEAGARTTEAAESLEALVHPLRAAILHHCPAVAFTQDADTSVASLGSGAFLWTEPAPADADPDCWRCEDGAHPAFDVAAYAEIGVKVLPAGGEDPETVRRTGDRGRIHSLWYCDAFEASRFGWAEVAFVVTKEDGGLYPGDEIAPSARAPGPRVAGALASGEDTLRVGYPLTSLASEEAHREFVTRWLGWFSDAALNEFRPRVGTSEPGGAAS